MKYGAWFSEYWEGSCAKIVSSNLRTPKGKCTLIWKKYALALKIILLTHCKVENELWKW